MTDDPTILQRVAERTAVLETKVASLEKHAERVNGKIDKLMWLSITILVAVIANLVTRLTP